MSDYSYDDASSVDNCYSDDNSAVSSTLSPPNSPSSYELDDPSEHDFINPPPGPTNLNFYGETSVTFNFRPPALIKIHSDAGKADCQIEKWEHDSNPDCDTVNSIDDDNTMKFHDDPHGTDDYENDANNYNDHDTDDKFDTDDEIENNTDDKFHPDAKINTDVNCVEKLTDIRPISIESSDNNIQFQTEKYVISLQDNDDKNSLESTSTDTSYSGTTTKLYTTKENLILATRSPGLNFSIKNSSSTGLNLPVDTTTSSPVPADETSTANQSENSSIPTETSDYVPNGIQHSDAIPDYISTNLPADNIFPGPDAPINSDTSGTAPADETPIKLSSTIFLTKMLLKVISTRPADDIFSSAIFAETSERLLLRIRADAAAFIQSTWRAFTQQRIFTRQIKSVKLIQKLGRFFLSKCKHSAYHSLFSIELPATTTDAPPAALLPAASPITADMFPADENKISKKTDKSLQPRCRRPSTSLLHDIDRRRRKATPLPRQTLRHRLLADSSVNTHTFYFQSFCPDKFNNDLHLVSPQTGTKEKFDATAESQTYLSNFPPLSGADVSIPAPSKPYRSPPPLDAPFETWLEAKFPARPKLFPIEVPAHNTADINIYTDAPKEMILPPLPKTTPRPPGPSRTPRRCRRTERSRRYAERHAIKHSPSQPRSANPDLLQPEIISGSAFMATKTKESLLRRMLHLPAVLPARILPPAPTTFPRTPKLDATAPSFAPPSGPSTPPFTTGTKRTPRPAIPFVSPTPSKKGGRIIFPPSRSPENPTSTPPRKSPSPLPPPPPLPSLFTTGGHPRYTQPSTFPRPTPNSGLHHIPHSPNMGGQFPNPQHFPTTPSSSSQFFRPPPFNVLHPYILQNIFDCLHSFHFLFTSLLTPIPVLLHPSPYGSNS